MKEAPEMYSKILARTLVVLSASLFLATSAHAGGFWNVDQTPTSYARGATGFVEVGDPSAVYLNPAALVANPGFQWLFGGNMFWDEHTFEDLAPEDARILWPYAPAGAVAPRTAEDLSATQVAAARAATRRTWRPA